MKQIISFDLWNTLIKSNPDHKTAQVQAYVEWFKKHLKIELHESTIKDIPLILRTENKKYDKLTEYNPTYNFDYSIRIRTAVMTIQHFDYLNKKDSKRELAYVAQVPDATEIKHLYVALVGVFINNPPLPMYPELREDLMALSKKYTLIINSNTGVMGNDVMIPTLESIGLLEPFSAFNFSNRSEYAKPDVRSFANGTKLPNVHIGDNDYADVIQSVKVTSVVYRHWTKERLQNIYKEIPNIIKNKRIIVNNSSPI